MNSTKVNLSLAEKQALKAKYSFRILVGLIFVFPILLGSLIIAVNCLLSFLRGNSDLSDLVGIILSFGVSYVFVKMGLPFYRQTLQNVRASHKIMIDTYITDIKTDITPKVGVSYSVFTESQISLQSQTTSVVINQFGYKDMKVGDRIRIHCLENNYTDILYIEQLT